MAQLLTLSYITNQYGPPSTVVEIACKDRALTDTEDLSPCTSLVRLDLSSNLLTSLLRLSSATRLTQLTLSGNHLTSLKHVHHLRGLLVLNVSGNRIDSLEPLHALPALRCLIANHNAIRALPDAPHALPGSLQTLVLSHNLLTSVSPLLHLLSLAKLSLSYNALQSLPSGVSVLLCLTELRLNHNRLSSLPPSLSQCSRLKLLDLGHNGLSALSLLQPLAALPYLRNLQLRGNECARAAGYREEVLRMMPLLSVLDSGKVQRAKAKKHRGEQSRERSPPGTPKGDAARLTPPPASTGAVFEEQKAALSALPRSPRKRPHARESRAEAEGRIASPSLERPRKRSASPAQPSLQSPSAGPRSHGRPLPSAAAQVDDGDAVGDAPGKRRRRTAPARTAVTEPIPATLSPPVVGPVAPEDAEAPVLDLAALTGAAERRQRAAEKERRREERLLKERGRAAGVVDVRVLRQQPTGFSLEELTRAHDRRDVGRGSAAARAAGSAWDDDDAAAKQPPQQQQQQQPLAAHTGEDKKLRRRGAYEHNQ